MREELASKLSILYDTLVYSLGSEVVEEELERAEIRYHAVLLVLYI